MWRPRNLWLLLALAVALVAWQLTRWITHVDHRPAPVLSIVFDERPPFLFERIPISVTALQRERHRFPEVALTSEGHLLFFVTPAMRSIAIRGIDSNQISCADAALSAGLASIPIQGTPGGLTIAIPERIRNALARAPDRRARIACALRRPLAAAPTFTERAVTIRVETSPGGAALLDVSALEDIDDLRFSGGLQAPLGGDRTRLVYSDDDVVSAEWVDVTAQEQRDIVLVLIGALSAIAAATAIEAIRPAVERRTNA